MRMDKYSNAAYGSAGLTAFFASLSLYEWGFIIGMAFSILLGLATFFMNRREQRKRTRLFEELVYKTDPKNTSAKAKVIASLMAKAPKDI
ncbi:HP1 family phage holin [Providencia rettgeri]